MSTDYVLIPALTIMIAKRLFDFSVAFAGLVVFFPVLVLLSAAVAISSGWPIFFRQVRVGRWGKGFKMVKFRTMKTMLGSEQGGFDAGNAARVTSVGRILRKTKLDEFPQLWNVLVGDMSLVGPRPEVRSWVDVYPERWARVHIVRPGMTDPASIEFRNEEEILASADDPHLMYRERILPRKLDYYERYLQSRSFWSDVKILIHTVWVIVFGSGMDER